VLPRVSDGFSADWLRLREPYDLRARDARLIARLAAWATGRRRRLRVLDLGAGTGSNLRCLAPALPVEQDWTLVEHDPALVGSGAAQLADAPVTWRYRRLDLAGNLEGLADEGPDVVTASALIDLVSADWLLRLAALRRATGAALYVALTYDGRVDWYPDDPQDGAVRRLVDMHQATDKGFGPALGPRAAAVLAAALAPDDGELATAPSDWALEPADRPIQLALLEGYLQAAAALPASPDLAAWEHRRRLSVEEGRSRLRVGHRDLLFTPR
jgi:hypothetical protein